MIKSMIKHSWPFTLSAFATTIYVSVDQVFLKIFLGSEAVGLYVVAVRFSEVWFFISSVVCTSLLPAILNAQKNKFNFRFLLTFIFIAAPFIIHILYGPAYETSIILLRIYIWSIIGFFISTGLQQMLLAQNKFRTILTLNVIGMVLSLVLNPIFISYFGVQGAAIANIFSYTLPVLMLLSSSRMKDQRKALIYGILKPL